MGPRGRFSINVEDLRQITASNLSFQYHVDNHLVVRRDRLVDIRNVMHKWPKSCREVQW